MRTLLGLIAVGLLLIQPASAQSNLGTFESVTYLGTAVGFTSTTIKPTGGNPMTSCTGKLETAQIRIRYDGTAPTATVGVLVDVGDVVTVEGTGYLQQLKGIRTGGTSGVIQWECTRLQ